MIKLEALGRNFGTKTVLQDLDLEVRRGERIAVTGANGSGKTTLLKILNTLIAPTSGDAWVGGASVRGDALKVRSSVAWVPASDQGFFPRLTGLENLVLFSSMRGIDAEKTQAKLSDWKEIAPLREALATPFYLCSAGMRQLLAIARALISDSDVILMDEPTRSLDPETAALVRTFMKARLAGKTVVFTTHSANDIEELATRKLKLQEGRLWEA